MFTVDVAFGGIAVKSNLLGAGSKPNSSFVVANVGGRIGGYE